MPLYGIRTLFLIPHPWSSPRLRPCLSVTYNPNMCVANIFWRLRRSVFFQACPLKSKSYYSAEEAEADHLSDDDGKPGPEEQGGAYWTHGEGAFGQPATAAQHSAASNDRGTFPPLTRAELEVSRHGVSPSHHTQPTPHTPHLPSPDWGGARGEQARGQPLPSHHTQSTPHTPHLPSPDSGGARGEQARGQPLPPHTVNPSHTTLTLP